MRNRVFALLTFLLLLSLATAASYLLIFYPEQPLKLKQQRLLQVSKGESFNGLCRQLQSEGVIRWCGPLKWYSKFHSEYRQIKAGAYLLEPEMTHRALLQRISQGKVHQFAVTFVEGEKLTEILARLANAEYLKHDVDDIDSIAAKLGSDRDNLEGLLFPDTYYYAAGSSSIDILRRAYAKMNAVLAEQWQNRDEGLPYRDAYEALIMASIIEKETAQAQERSLIASVFVNRLVKHMRLQTDPTVIYGLGEQFDGNITRADLKRTTPYNTYRIKGLPPTPIAMPGQESIVAALHPAQTEYLYFVAKKDGTHQFSETLKAHNEAVRKYQLGGQNAH